MKSGKRVIGLVSGAVNMAVLAAILLLLSFSCYAIWDSERVHEGARSAHYEIYKPTVENESMSFMELQEINPDVFGWLTIYGTHIDYPLVQGEDNWKYVNANALGKYSFSGALFLDSNCSRDFSGFNSIIYGHHMEKQTMFGEIGLFAEKFYFDTRRYGMLYFEGREHGLEFFAFLHTDAYDGSVFRLVGAGLDERQQYLDRMMGMALSLMQTDDSDDIDLHWSGARMDERRQYLDKLLGIAYHIRPEVEVNLDEHIVLLSTCSNISTNGRDILIGIITDELFEDTFHTEIIGRSVLTVDALLGLWAQTPLGMKIFVIALVLLLLALILSNGYIFKRK